MSLNQSGFSTAQKKEVYANNSGWVVEGLVQLMTGNDN